MHRVLVLKGGGVKGVLQLESLELLERHFDKPICDIFDLIVGTSVGSITGGILATGKFTMAKYFDIFLKYLPKIFKKQLRILPLKPIYERENFNKMWDNYFPPEEGLLLMKDCKTRFMCTAVNLCDFKTHFFKSWEKKDGKIELRDAIARSFAAPYFFGPVVDEENKAVWFDGGAGESNTPLNIAYSETINLGWYREKVEFICLGTGQVDLSIPFEEAKESGILKQMLTFINPKQGGLARIQSTLNQVDQMRIMARAEPLIDFHYYDVEIGPEYAGMDRLELVQEYLGFGSIMAQKLETDLKEIGDLIPKS
jgi:hypothetical protein